MFWTKSFISTLREAPEGAESVSHRLMLRTQMVRMLVAGVYSYLPLGWKVLKKIEEIIREEMVRVGAQEVLLPAAEVGESIQHLAEFCTEVRVFPIPSARSPL